MSVGLVRSSIDSKQEYTVRNHQNWSLHAVVEENSLTINLFDPFGLPYREPVQVVLNKTSDESSFEELLQREIQHISPSVRTFQFQVQKTEVGIALIFGPYGLAGGGRMEGIVGGAFTAILGIGMMLKGNRKLGGVVFSAGVAAAKSAYDSTPENFSGKKCVVDAAMGGATSIVSGALVGQALPAVSSAVNHVAPALSATVNIMATKVITQVGVGMFMSGTQDVLSGEVPDLKKTLIAGASSGCGTLAGAGMASALEEVADDALGLLVKGGCEGAANAGGRQVAVNILEGNHVTEGLASTTTMGGFLGAATALPDAIKALTPADQPAPLPKEEPKAPKPAEPVNQLPEKPPVPPKPDLSKEKSRLDKQATDLGETEKALAKKELAFSNAFKEAQNFVIARLKAGFKECARWARGNPQASVNRILNGEEVQFRNGKHISSMQLENKITNPASERKTLEQQKLEHQQQVKSYQDALNASPPSAPPAAVVPKQEVAAKPQTLQPPALAIHKQEVAPKPQPPQKPPAAPLVLPHPAAVQPQLINPPVAPAANPQLPVMPVVPQPNPIAAVAQQTIADQEKLFKVLSHIEHLEEQREACTRDGKHAQGKRKRAIKQSLTAQIEIHNQRADELKKKLGLPI